MSQFDRRKAEMTLGDSEGYVDQSVRFGIQTDQARLRREQQRIEAELAALGAPPIQGHSTANAWTAWEKKQEQIINEKLRRERLEEKLAAAGFSTCGTRTRR